MLATQNGFPGLDIVAPDFGLELELELDIVAPDSGLEQSCSHYAIRQIDSGSMAVGLCSAAVLDWEHYCKMDFVKSSSDIDNKDLKYQGLAMAQVSLPSAVNDIQASFESVIIVRMDF